MTRTASKGAIRAAATARRNRHAQRTPLPGDTSRPVKGNPTAEALRDEVSKAKAPRKKSAASKAKAAPKAEETPQAQQDRRAFGDQTESLAAQAAEMIAAGKKQREVAAALGLAEGKTGTAQVRRLLKVANGGARPPRQVKPKQPRVRTVQVIAEDGSVTREQVTGDGGVPMQRNVPAYRLTARDKRRGVGESRMCPVNVFPLGEQQVRNLTSLFESQGYTVQAEKAGA